mmetsp:Transcript_18444/g.57779  ORF Transcript_18444/g.57779 Transcript_18444/m.57779 type:complete len:319 (+) Transcript_18444:72-1028(+)
MRTGALSGQATTEQRDVKQQSGTAGQGGVSEGAGARERVSAAGRAAAPKSAGGEGQALAAERVPMQTTRTDTSCSMPELWNEVECDGGSTSKGSQERASVQQGPSEAEEPSAREPQSASLRSSSPAIPSSTSADGLDLHGSVPDEGASSVMLGDAHGLPGAAAAQPPGDEGPPGSEWWSVARRAADLLHAAADAAQQQPEGAHEPGGLREGFPDRHNVVWTLHWEDLDLPRSVSPTPSDAGVAHVEDSADGSNNTNLSRVPIAECLWQTATWQAGGEASGSEAKGAAEAAEGSPQPPPPAESSCTALAGSQSSDTAPQ